MANGNASHRIAREIRAARAWADLSREQLSVRVGVSEMTIGRWERGDWQARPPGRAQLEAIARATKLPDAYLSAGCLAPEPTPGKTVAEAADRSRRRQPHAPDEDPEPPPEEDQGS